MFLDLPNASYYNDIAIKVITISKTKMDNALEIINGLNSRSRNGRYTIVMDKGDPEDFHIIYRVVYTSIPKLFNSEIYYDLFEMACDVLKERYLQLKKINTEQINKSSYRNIHVEW
ncbi:hypothetical protein [Mitsuokella multacida]|uniref:hypothetical protein n=1 Tax=Mitsuokella multacida TaxID=52226 RepID=UPI00242F1B6A|nr:hypothetical protein [Mitsuokella multacida]